MTIGEFYRKPGLYQVWKEIDRIYTIFSGFTGFSFFLYKILSILFKNPVNPVYYFLIARTQTSIANRPSKVSSSRRENSSAVNPRIDAAATSELP